MSSFLYKKIWHGISIHTRKCIPTKVFSHPHVFYIHSFKILVKMTILYVYILIGDEVLWMQKLSQ